MALSPEDRAFYEEKLGWKGFIYLYVATVLVGAIMWPAILYVHDESNGQTAQWSFTVVRNLAISGMLLGTAMSVIMFVLARFYLWLGWLPRRR
jgi:hypothetical protein